MNKDNSFKTRKLTGMAILTALVVVFQLLATFVKFGSFPITLTLIPIVIGAMLYGALSGAILGGAFGFIVLVACIFGWDPGGYILWNANPLITAVLCLLKGIAAGFAAGMVHKFVLKFTSNQTAAVVYAAIVCPIVNTGIFCVSMALFFHDTLVAWAGETEVLYYIIFGLIGVNFIIELSVNAVLSPAVAAVMKQVKKTGLR